MPSFQGMLAASTNQPSQAIPMASRHTNQRSSPRAFVLCPISIELESGSAHGIVRDISADGIFFYSNFKPTLNMHVHFVLRVKGKNIRGRGKIVRIQQGTPGSATGIAVKLSDWDD